MFSNKHMNIVTKKGGKSEKKNYQKQTYIGSKKRLKKSSGKSVKTRFFYKHMNIVTKNGGKKARKIFYQKQTNIASKKTMEKNRL